MPQKKNKNEALILGLALAITGGLLATGGWWASQQGFVPFNSTRNQIGSINRHAKVTLKVLGDTFSGYSTLRSAAFQGTLAESQVALNYADEFDQAKRAAAIDRNNADLIVTTLDQFLIHQPKGKMVALIDRTVGADAVVLNTRHYPQLKSLLDLDTLVKQKQATGERLKIVFAGDTPSEFLATVLDTKFDNFNLADFEVVRVADASKAWQKMQDSNANVALAVLWEPFVTEAKLQGNTVVLSSADAPKVIVDVVVASDRLLQSNPEAVQEFVKAYYRRIDASVQNNSELTRQIASDGNLSDSEAAVVAKGIQFFTSVEAKDWMASGTLSKRIGAIASILTLSGRISNLPAHPEELYTAQFVNPAANQTATLIQMIADDNPELASRLKGTSPTTLVARVSEAQVKKASAIGNLKVRGEVKFETGSAQLTTEGRQTLDQLVAEIGEFNPSTVAIKVQGHTSQTGSANLNQILSQDRANVVANYLKTKNSTYNFVAEGLGFSQPLPGANPSSPLNQRTVIRLVRIGT
jgi:outer membrane protein OmpA-like peptidoglycan-associated protein